MKPSLTIRPAYAAAVVLPAPPATYPFPGACPLVLFSRFTTLAFICMPNRTAAA